MNLAGGDEAFPFTGADALDLAFAYKASDVAEAHGAAEFGVKLGRGEEGLDVRGREGRTVPDHGVTS